MWPTSAGGTCGSPVTGRGRLERGQSSSDLALNVPEPWLRGWGCLSAAVGEAWVLLGAEVLLPAAPAPGVCLGLCFCPSLSPSHPCLPVDASRPIPACFCLPISVHGWQFLSISGRPFLPPFQPSLPPAQAGQPSSLPVSYDKRVPLPLAVVASCLGALAEPAGVGEVVQPLPCRVEAPGRCGASDSHPHHPLAPRHAHATPHRPPGCGGGRGSRGW